MKKTLRLCLWLALVVGLLVLLGIFVIPGGVNFTVPAFADAHDINGDAPEIDPRSIASAVALLVCGVLVMTDRVRRHATC